MEANNNNHLSAISLDDPNTLTLFDPLPASIKNNDNKKRQSISTFLGTVFNNFSSKFRGEPSSAIIQSPPPPPPPPTTTTILGENDDDQHQKSSPPSYGRQLSSLFARYNNNNNNEPSSAAVGLKTIWARDDACKHCYDCSAKFSTFHRRHHCRFCGRIFCDVCSQYRIPGQPFGITVDLRACKVCYRQTLRVLLENHATSIQSDVLEKLTVLYLEIAPSPEPAMKPRSFSSLSLTATTNNNNPVELQRQESRPRRSSDVLDINFETDSIVSNATTSPSLMDDDNNNNKSPVLIKPSSPPNADGNEETIIADNVPSAAVIRLPSAAASDCQQKAMTLEIDQAILDSLSHFFATTTTNNINNIIYRQNDVESALNRLYDDHLIRLCSFLLGVEQLDVDKWQRSLVQAVRQVVRNVHHQINNNYDVDTFDLRRCVKFKKVYDPSLSAHFEYVDGLVFTKCSSHRLMATTIRNPRVMLIKSGLDFEREGQQLLTTLDMIVNQETEQMHRYVSQIASIKPNLLFCGGSIPMQAIPYLIENKITAASFVKPHLLRQMSRYTGATILPSVDSLSLLSTSGGQTPSIRLGTCRTFASFLVHKHSRLQKSFICLSGCEPVGCTVVIRDKSWSDLIKVKKIIRWLIVALNDGKIMARYLSAFRVDPFSLPIIGATNNNLMAKIVEEEPTPALSSNSDSETIKAAVLMRRGSFSTSRDFKLVQQIIYRRKLAKQMSLESVVERRQRSASFTNMEAAFALINSGLLTLSPLVKLPDPSKKSALFDASPSRSYFEAPLFSLLGASFAQGNTPTIAATLMPPLLPLNVVEKPVHRFFTRPLTCSFNSKQMQLLMADFRRNGSLFDIITKPVQPCGWKEEENHRQSRLPPLIQRSVSENVDNQQSSSSPQLQQQNNVAWAKPLSFFECQSFQVLVSSFSLDSHLSPYNFCYGPCLESWPFYAHPEDHSFGQFLEEMCYMPSAFCNRPGCGAATTDHVRRFAANNGRVDVVIRAISQPIGNNADIVTWSMCHLCNAVTPRTTIDQNVLWQLSFASYLQHKFYGVNYNCVPCGPKKCPHSFQRDYLQFFAKEHLIAVFKYSQVDVYDIVIPVELPSSSSSTSLQQKLLAHSPDGPGLVKTASTQFEQVANYLETLRSNLTVLLGGKRPSKTILGHLLALEAKLIGERRQFAGKLAQIEATLVTGREDGLVEKSVEESVLALFQGVCQSWLDWNGELKALVNYIRCEAAAMPRDIPNITSGGEAVSASVGTRTPTPLEIHAHHRQSSSAVGLSAMVADEGLLLSEQEEVFVPHLSLPSVEEAPFPNTPKTLFGRSLLHFSATTDNDLLNHPLFSSKLKLPLSRPFSQKHHYICSQTLLYPVGVYDDEPSSLIAFFLATDEYRQQLTNNDNKDQLSEVLTSLETGTGGDLQFTLGDDSNKKTASLARVSQNSIRSDSLSQFSIAGALEGDLSILSRCCYQPKDETVVQKDEAHLVTMSRQPSFNIKKETTLFLNKAARCNITVEWNDVTLEKDMTTRFSVTAYQAAIFAEIRSILIPSSNVGAFKETAFVQSLARCKSWQASGGKSGAKYLITLDKKYILKHLHKTELQTLLEMAPSYLEYIKTTRDQKRPSALVPMLGAYNVTFENNATGRRFRCDVVVMEYLFRSHFIAEKFDLKGSQRNRLVKNVNKPSSTNNIENNNTKPTTISENSSFATIAPNSDQPSEPAASTETAVEEVDIVLLDENLLIRSLQDPLHVYPHSKKLLLQAITADTLFLANSSIMDYSLLVGIDPQAHCIVAGIIDYLRPYTWDKMVESVVKASGLLGGSRGKAPTIVHPNHYRDRFIAAMRRFFHEVPDHFLGYETHNLAHC